MQTRRKVGRPRKEISFVRHSARERVDASRPMLVTMKLRENQRNLRTKYAFNEFRKAAEAAKAFGLRIVEFSVLSNHIHLLVETDSNKHLERGMKSLTIRLAKNLKVKFKERFHLRLVKTARQLKNTILYVLTNAAKHYHRRFAFDWFSSLPAHEDLTRWKIQRPQFIWYQKPHAHQSFYESILSRARSFL